MVGGKRVKKALLAIAWQPLIIFYQLKVEEKCQLEGSKVASVHVSSSVKTIHKLLITEN